MYKRKNLITQLLNIVNLYDSRKIICKRLSGGQKRRLEFITSIIHEPEILILDEPFTGLDIDIINDLWSIIKKIKLDGVSLIIISHNLLSIEKNADRAVIVDKGKVIRDFNLREIRTSPSASLERKFLACTK